MAEEQKRIEEEESKIPVIADSEELGFETEKKFTEF